MFHRSGSDHPNLFGLPPGVDFARKALAGLEARLPGSSPEALARVTIFVNTRRMQRRMRQIYDDGPPRLLPRIKLITDLSFNAASGGLAAPAPPLRRQLELTQLISALLDKEPKFAPRAALFDLASSLAELMQEMEGEGVGPEVLRALDVSDSSGHWQRTLDFLSIAGHYLDNAEEAPSREARQRLSVIRLIASWEQTPPADPIIVAGSTGSRGTTVLLLEAVARLPNGAVILPGFDFDMPAPAWTVLDQALTSEDHPQFRFARLCERLNMLPGDVQDWANCAPARPARNALISLSLRPAPVTDQWLADGPSLGDLTEATKGLTLIEAPGPREEAEAIALQLRVALDNGQTAALITPDRMLTRRVAAALDRWQIIPDDSAGLPLALTPPGRFLRHVATLFDRPLTPGPLLALLKHPLCHADVDRGQHVLFSHELELFMRRNGRPRPGPDDIERFVQKTGKDDAVRVAWGQWLVGCLAQTAEQTSARQSLSAHVERHLQLAEALSSGEAKPAAAALWAEAAGRKALIATQELRRHADIGAPLSPLEYSALFDGILAMHEVRDRDKGHPHVLIWGTLEARVQGADLVILGGLNDGIWPQTPKADPWLNRQMRAQAGLLLPERRVGLSAHDYMQAVAGAQVCLSRTIRSEDAPTVPSRWLNRLTNLMEGLPDQNGPKALADMRKAGQDWLDGAAALSAVQKPVAPAGRPSPRPPAEARPKQLSVTQIERLLSDPYTIYAQKILRLRALDPLHLEADARLRGTVLHKVFERFICEAKLSTPEADRATLLAIAAQVLEQECPWPVVQRLWLAQIGRAAGWFIASEAQRQLRAKPHMFEQTGSCAMDGLDFTLTAKADRIDMAEDGSAVLYDYKTGALPSKQKQIQHAKQLLIEAAIVEQGGFAQIGAQRVSDARYIGLGSDMREMPAPLADQPPELIWAELRALVQLWQDPARGYTARRDKQDKFASDYDHLSRFGEWDVSDPPAPEDLS